MANPRAALPIAVLPVGFVADETTWTTVFRAPATSTAVLIRGGPCRPGVVRVSRVKRGGRVFAGNGRDENIFSAGRGPAVKSCNPWSRPPLSTAGETWLASVKLTTCSLEAVVSPDAVCCGYYVEVGAPGSVPPIKGRSGTLKRRGDKGGDQQPIRAIAGNRVAGAGRGSSNRATRCRLNQYTVKLVWHSSSSGRVGADEITLYDYSRGGWILNEDPIGIVAGNQVACAGCCSTNYRCYREASWNIVMPFPWLGKGAALPSAMVPMRFPSIRLSVVVAQG